jgi:hypothetical protein
MELEARHQSDEFAMQNSQRSEQIKAQIEADKMQAAHDMELGKMEAQRIIEQGKAATQMRVEEMRIESSEAIAKYKADLEAQTKLQLETMKNECSMKQHEMIQIPEAADNSELMDEHKAQFDAFMEYLKTPKQITRDSDGLAISIH